MRPPRALLPDLSTVYAVILRGFFVAILSGSFVAISLGFMLMIVQTFAAQGAYNTTGCWCCAGRDGPCLF